MILEYQVNETNVQPDWLKTLYELVDDVNCKSKTYVDESFDKTHGHFSRTRTIEICGSETMVSSIKSRMERYLHFISYNNKSNEISTTIHEDLPF